MSSGPVKIVSVIRRRPDLTFEQFVDHWQQRHPLYVNQLPGLRRNSGSTTCARSSLRSRAPRQTACATTKKNFIGDQEWFIATDHPIID
jgi:hypothetical protein